MISIRFLRVRSPAPAPFVDASARGGASIMLEPATPLAAKLPDRLEANHLTGGKLVHASLIGVQVDVPEHLREGQERLGDGDVAPQLLGDLIGGARPLRDQLEDLLRPPPVKRDALVDQGAVVGDRVAVSWEDDPRRQLPGAPKRLEIPDERLGASVGSVERSRDQGIRRDVGEKVIRGYQDPTLRVPEQRVGGTVTRAVLDLE